MKQALLFLLLLSPSAVLADAGAPDELAQLKEKLSAVREEQQSVYQNYQMTKELRLQAVEEDSTPKEGSTPPIMQELYAACCSIATIGGGGPPHIAYQPYGINTAPPPDYEEALRAQREREDRIKQYTSDLGRLSARFLELEDQKKALLKQIAELEQRANKPGSAR